MQKWDKPRDRAQIVNVKNGVKMFKNGKNVVFFQSYGYQNVKHGAFCSFCWRQQTISHSLGKTFKYNWEIFLSKHDDKTNDPIFSSLTWIISVGLFHFCISRPSKFSSMRCPLLLYVLVCKIHS